METPKSPYLLEIINYGVNVLVKEGISNAKKEIEWFCQKILNIPNLLLKQAFEENEIETIKVLLNAGGNVHEIISEDGNTTAIQINLITDSKLMELARYRSDLISTNSINLLNRSAICLGSWLL